jgi:hypothetical protein
VIALNSAADDQTRHHTVYKRPGLERVRANMT